MGKFAQYLGKTEMTIDGQNLKLDVQLEDIKAFTTATRGNNITEEGIDKIANAMKKIMKRSYPSEPEKELNAFVDKKLVKFMEEFSIEVMGVPREEMKKSFREAGESEQSGKKA